MRGNLGRFFLFLSFLCIESFIGNFVTIIMDLSLQSIIAQQTQFTNYLKWTFFYFGIYINVCGKLNSFYSLIYITQVFFLLLQKLFNSAFATDFLCLFFCPGTRSDCLLFVVATCKPNLVSSIWGRICLFVLFCFL